MTTKQLRLRRADTCSGCGAALSVGTHAEWDSATRAVRCLACVNRIAGHPGRIRAVVTAAARRAVLVAMAVAVAVAMIAVVVFFIWPRAINSIVEDITPPRSSTTTPSAP